MATRATPTMLALSQAWERLYPSAQLSGIVGDLSHTQRGGYHISIEDQVNPDNYSVVRPDDKAPPGKWPRDCAAGIDMNLDLTDMKVCHERLTKVWRDRQSDPRAKYINAHNGWNGDGNAGRYDWVSGGEYAATDDHKWHIHLEIRRRYVNSTAAIAAILSILRGDTVTQYRNPQPPEEIDVSFTKEKFTLTDATADALGKEHGTQMTGALLLQTIGIQLMRIAKDVDAENAEVVPTAEQVADAVLAKLGAGGTPEQKAELLRLALGQDAAAVGRLLAGG